MSETRTPQHPSPKDTSPHVLLRTLFQPTDTASLAAFRVIFGLIAFVSTTRFILNDWIEPFYLKPSFAFKATLFPFIQTPSPPVLHALFYTLAGLSLMIASGTFYRAAAILFFLIFTYIELIDLTYYLNHYYLVSLISFLFIFLPLHKTYSVDALLHARRSHNTTPQHHTHPFWMVALLRFQVGLVYVFAAIAKITTDWLIHAQPLNIWLASTSDVPLLSPLFRYWYTALFASWAGFLYDLLIVPFLLHPKTRPYAFAILLVFHTSTGLLLNIGMFPVIMSGCALIFFSTSWPRKALTLINPSSPHTTPPPQPTPTHIRRNPKRTALLITLSLWVAFHTLFPLRTFLYPGDVLWHEQGMRWSWRVVVREKNGTVTYRAILPNIHPTRERLIQPSRYLTSQQEREFATQPDLILQLAHHIADDLRTQGHTNVQLRVDANVSLNGRPPTPLIDPTVDLTTLQDPILPAPWITHPNLPPPLRINPKTR